MKEIRIFSYIKKYRFLIIAVSVLMGILFYKYFSRQQTYTASAIIQYTNDKAAEGLAPDGTNIDTTEIYSSEVMTRVFQKLGLTFDENNMDAIRAAIWVEPVLSEEEEVVQEALNEKGEVPEEKTTAYKVSYTVNKNDVSNGKEFATTLLTTMLNVYTEVYAENHVNKSVFPNAVNGIYDKNYDYIEMIELIDSSVEQTIENLDYKSDLQFRSADTGYSFRDLEGEFSLVKSVDISNIFAYILENRITKNQDVLLSKYENRIKNYSLDNEAANSQVGGLEEIISAYVEMMRRSGNTDFTYEYILQEVYDNYYKDINAEPGLDVYKNADVTTEYDELMNGYVNRRTDFETTLIDISYAEYILGIYSGNTDSGSGISVKILENPADYETESGVDSNAKETNDENASDDETKHSVITFESNTKKKEEIVSTEEEKEAVYEMIKSLVERVNSLHESLVATNHEYNLFAGAENISVVTDTAVTEGINLMLYAILAVGLFGVIGCALAVVGGRTAEILEFYLYVDKKLEIPNRAGCDRYVAKYANKMLTEEVSCIYFRMTDIEAKNRMYGREQCDAMMKDFCGILQQVFPQEQSFIALNGPGQFIIFVNEVEREIVRAYVKEIGRRCIDYNDEMLCRISYVCGLSSSMADDIYDMKKLMLDAIRKASATVK